MQVLTEVELNKLKQTLGGSSLDTSTVPPTIIVELSSQKYDSVNKFDISDKIRKNFKKIKNNYQKNDEQDLSYNYEYRQNKIINFFYKKEKLFRILYKIKKLNQGTKYEKELLSEINKTINQISKGLEEAYSPVYKLQVGKKEADIYFPTAKIGIEVKAPTGTSGNTGRNNFAFLTLGNDFSYKSEEFYTSLTNDKKNIIDKYAEEYGSYHRKSKSVIVKQFPEKFPSEKINLTGQECKKLLDKHYTLSQFIQLKDIGFFFIHANNTLKLDNYTIKPIQISSGQIILRLKESSGFYNVVAELQNCIVTNSQDAPNLDDPKFREVFSKYILEKGSGLNKKINIFNYNSKNIQNSNIIKR